MEKVVNKETIRSLKGIKPITVWLAILIFIVVTLFVDRPPQSKPHTAPAQQFSAERAMQHLQHIAKETRPTGSERIKDVRNYLVTELKKLGVEPEIQQETGVSHDLKPVDLHNIVAVIKGKGNGKAVMLSTHYDSVDLGPGANDAGVSVAALVETVRALKSGDALENDVWIVITDGEEIGLLGAEAFWKKAEHQEKIGLVVNFEARGSKGASLMFQTSVENGTLIQHFSKAVSEPVAYSFMGDLYRLLPNDTDMTVSLAHGIPGINFAYLDGWTTYHTPEDNLNNVNLATLQHHGENALAMARQFGNIDLNNLRSTDHVYFSLMGQLIHYPNTIVPPITIVLWLVTIALFVFAFKQQQVRLRGMVTSLLALIVSAVLSFTLCYLLNKLIYLLWAKKMTLFNGATYDAYLYHISFLLVALLVHGFIRKKLNDRINVLEMMLTGKVLFLLLLTASIIWLPGASYLLMFPLIIQSIIISCSLYKKNVNKVLNGVPAMLLMVIAPVMLFTPLFYLMFIAMPPSRNIIVVVLIVIMLALLDPVQRLISSNHRWFAVIAGGIIILLLAWGWINAVPSADRPIFERSLHGH